MKPNSNKNNERGTSIAVRNRLMPGFLEATAAAEPGLAEASDVLSGFNTRHFGRFWGTAAGFVNLAVGPAGRV